MGELPEITPTDLKARIEDGANFVIVDVREADEIEIADLPQYSPLRIPVNQFVARMDELSREDDIVVYCRSGGRSGWAVKQMLKAGYEKALNLKGGILAWRAEVDPKMKAY